MTEKQTKCEKLYKDYQALVQKIDTQAKELGSGTIDASGIAEPSDFLKKEEIRQELLHCRDVLELKPEEWFEIENG